jgi:hypothetical protein
VFPEPVDLPVLPLIHAGKGPGNLGWASRNQDHVAVYVQDAVGRFPQQPPQTFYFNLRAEPERALRLVQVAALVEDLNGDGCAGLILSNRAEVFLLAHLYRVEGIYAGSSDWTRSFPSQIDMSDGVVLQGRWPNVEGDFDGDGKADLLVAGNDEVAVHLATPGTLCARDPAAQLPIKTSSRMIVRDLTDNRRADSVLWYNRSPEWKGAVQALINSGKEW